MDNQAGSALTLILTDRMVTLPDGFTDNIQPSLDDLYTQMESLLSEDR